MTKRSNQVELFRRLIRRGMKKGQILIVAIGAGLIVLFFQFPKAIVTQERKLQDESSSVTTEVQSAHEVHVSEKDQTELADLKKKASDFSDIEKKHIFADSLVSKYRSLHMYDSVAYFFEQFSNATPTKENLTKTADAFADAFSYFQISELNEKARANYKKVLELDSTDLDVKTKLAMSFVGSQTPMEGISLLKEVLAKDPKNKGALFNYGVLLHRIGKFDKSISTLKDLLTIDSENGRAYFYLGLCFEQTGKTKEAGEAFEKARDLEKDPIMKKTIEDYLKNKNI